MSPAYSVIFLIDELYGVVGPTATGPVAVLVPVDGLPNNVSCWPAVTGDSLNGVPKTALPPLS